MSAYVCLVENTCRFFCIQFMSAYVCLFENTCSIVSIGKIVYYMVFKKSNCIIPIGMPIMLNKCSNTEMSP